jgi:hypothetical protein
MRNKIGKQKSNVCTLRSETSLPHFRITDLPIRESA